MQISTIGIDIGKNSFHFVGFDARRDCRSTTMLAHATDSGAGEPAALPRGDGGLLWRALPRADSGGAGTRRATDSEVCALMAAALAFYLPDECTQYVRHWGYRITTQQSQTL